MDFSKFVQFTKVEESTDGKVRVFGIATLEEPDLDNEICDYDAAKDAYQAWSDAAKERTTNAGQQVSLGNIRLQHGLDIGGKAVQIDYDDAGRKILVGSQPINQQVMDDLLSGFYTGYSQGGSYAWRKCADCGKNLTLQQAANYCPACKKMVPVLFGLKRVSEISYVDSPCTGVGFEYVKSDGSKKFVKFTKRGATMELTQEQLNQIADRVRKGETKTKRVGGKDCPPNCFAYVGDPEKTATWKLPIKSPDDDVEWEKRHIRNALARFNQTQGIPENEKKKVKDKIIAAARKHGIDVDDEGNTKGARDFIAAVEKRASSAGLEKGLWQVGQLASVLQTLAFLYEDAVIERECEGDESDVPDDLKEVLDNLVEVFIASATEEARELAAKKADINKGGSTVADNTAELEKAAKKSMAHHFAKSAAHHEKKAEHHRKAAESHEEMRDAAKKAHDAHKEKSKKADVEGGEEPTAHVAAAEFYKAAADHHDEMADHHEKLAKLHDKHAEHHHKMAESHDKEEADRTKEEERKRREDEKEEDKEKKGKKAAGSGSSISIGDAMAEAFEEFKKTDAFKGMMQAHISAEVQKAFGNTAAPDGVTKDGAGANARGAAAAPGAATIVPRSGDQFKLASAEPSASETGL